MTSLFTTKGQRIGVGSSAVLARLAKKYEGCGIAVVAALQKYARDNEKDIIVRSNVAELGWTLMEKALKDFETRTDPFEEGNFEETAESSTSGEGKDYEEMSSGLDAEVAGAEEGEGEELDDNAGEDLDHGEQD